MAAKELQEHEIAKRINKQTTGINIGIKDKVMAFITASLSPEKVFMLHHETGIKEYFDLLVIIPETTQTNFTYYEQVIAMANIENAALHVSLHKSATIQKQMEDGHIFYTIACSKENLVYDDGIAALPQPGKDVLKALAEKAGEDFNLSYKKAESFLAGAGNYYGENNKEMAAFMLQQAVELTLRGLVSALLGNCAKTHCFKELKRQLKRCVPGLPYLFSADEIEENRLLRLLEKAYLEARYTNRFTISDNDFTLLTEGAENLHEKAGTVFMQKMQTLNSYFNVDTRV